MAPSRLQLCPSSEHHSNPREGSTTTFAFSWMGKLRHREVRKCAPSHQASSWHRLKQPQRVKVTVTAAGPNDTHTHHACTHPLSRQNGLRKGYMAWGDFPCVDLLGEVTCFSLHPPQSPLSHHACARLQAKSTSKTS